MDPPMFSGREKNESRSLPMMPVRDVVIDYIRTHSPLNFQTQGRISFVK